MKRHPLALLAIVAVTGLGLVVTAPNAFGKTAAHLTQNATVGHTLVRGLGNGANFAVATCTSASPATVPCQVWNNQPPHDAVRLWCLGPTLAPGVAVTVTYIPNAPRAPTPSTILTVHCKQPRTPSVPTPGFKTSFPLNPNGPAYTVTACSTNIIGTQCTFAGEQITKKCDLSATLNTLPVQVTASLTLAGPGAIQGLTMQFTYECI